LVYLVVTSARFQRYFLGHPPSGFENSLFVVEVADGAIELPVKHFFEHWPG
jgi:hypothetical protein